MFNRFSGFMALIVALILVVGLSSLYVVHGLEDKNANLKGQLVQKNEENARLSQNLVIADGKIASLESQITTLQREVASWQGKSATLQAQGTQLKERVAELEGFLENSIRSGYISRAVADKALTGLSAFMPERSILWMHQDDGVGALDTMLIYWGGHNRDFEIEFFRPEIYLIKPNTPKGTTSLTWGLVRGVKEDDTPVYFHIQNRLLELRRSNPELAKLKD